MSDKNIDWLKRLQLLKNALNENGVNSSLCVELETKINGYELDFTEHDKVFEDKIELLNRNLNLQKDKRCEAEIERNYLAERFNQLKDENDELKQRIAELENKETVDLPFDALETANMLINATYKRENCMTGTIYDKDIYDIDDLEQIAEHLLVYCKHNREDEE